MADNAGGTSSSETAQTARWTSWRHTCTPAPPSTCNGAPLWLHRPTQPIKGCHLSTVNLPLQKTLHGLEELSCLI